MLLLLACTPDDSASKTFGPDLHAAPLATLDAVAQVTWTSAEPVVGTVRYTFEGVAYESDPEPAATTTHDVRVVGIPEGETVTLEAWDGESVGTVEYTAPYGPAILPRETASGELDGWVLTHSVREDGDAAVVFDTLGRAVWWRTFSEGERIFNVSHEADGNVWVTTNPGDYVDTVGHVHRLTLDGRVDDTFEIDRVHSGAVPLPDGGFAYVAKQAEPFEDGDALYDTIEERAADGTTSVVFDFSAWYPPEQLCAHWTVDLGDTAEVRYFDWTHANSLVLSADAASYHLMLRHYDALLKIDRATGGIEWTLGGLHGDFAFSDAADRFSHAHTSTVSDGRLLLMDNGNHHEPPASRVMEYRFDAEAKTVTPVRELPEENGTMIEYLGDVKDTPDGGLLISWTTMGRIDRVDTDGAVVWRMDSELGTATGRVTLLSSLAPLTVAGE